MKCWHCNTELVWGADFDGEDYGCEEQYSIVSVLSCPECNCHVEVYFPKEQKNETEEIRERVSLGKG